MSGGILACDPATRLGWSYADVGGDPVWGNERLGRDGAGAGEVGAALCVFLEARLAMFRPAWVVYEAPYVPQGDKQLPLNPQTLRRLLGLPFLIDTICEQHGVDCREVISLHYTKFFTGTGRFPGATPAARRKAKKAATIEACKARGWVATEDEADALALLCFAEFQLFPLRCRPISPGPLFADATA